MTALNQLFTAGIWKTKPGKKSEFIRAWQEFADWSIENRYGAGEALLLQDLDNLNCFISLGPWESDAQVAEWRARPEFQEFVSRVRVLCDEFTPMNMKTVGAAG